MEEVKLCQGKDIFERMNYLYQASQIIAKKNRVAASCYGHHMIGCAKKAVLHLEPDIKRTICKLCQSPLIPGETARVRLTSRPVKGVKWTCLTCLNTKRYPTSKGYKLWIDQPEATVEIFRYNHLSEDNSSINMTNVEKQNDTSTAKSVDTTEQVENTENR